jgi:hypothetical protein
MDSKVAIAWTMTDEVTTKVRAIRAIDIPHSRLKIYATLALTSETAIL